MPWETDPYSENSMKKLEAHERRKLAAQAKRRIYERVTIDLTRELIDKVIAGVAFGNYPGIVARDLGVPQSTFQNWLSDGETYWLEGQQTGEFTTMYDPDGLRVQLYLAVRQAEAGWEVGMVNDMNVVIEQNGKWQGRLNMLERRVPERWGRRDVTRDGEKTWDDVIREFQKDRAKLAS